MAETGTNGTTGTTDTTGEVRETGPAGADRCAASAAKGHDEACVDRPLIWERMERAAHLPKTTLTHQQIGEAAVELADAEGLEAVSMRKLAERLGVATMALYRYVANKDELYMLMVDQAAFDSTLPDEPPADWRVMMHAFGKSVWDGALKHPWLFQASALIPNAVTPRRLAGMELSLQTLERTGLDPTSVMLVLRMVDAYVRGAANGEVALRQLGERHGIGPDGDLRMIYREHMVWAMGSGRYPTINRVIGSGIEAPDNAADFVLGLDFLLDGIAARFGLD